MTALPSPRPPPSRRCWHRFPLGPTDGAERSLFFLNLHFSLPTPKCYPNKQKARLMVPRAYSDLVYRAHIFLGNPLG